MPAALAEPELLIKIPEEVKTGGPGGGGPHDSDPGGRGWGGDDDEWTRRKPASGPSAGMLGMIATLVSITALFATIVIAYMVRSKTRANWGSVPLPSWLWISTVLIVLSSATLEAARQAFRRVRTRQYSRWIIATFFLGLAFVVSQALALRQLVGLGVYLRQNPHSSLFYIITGAHGLHVMGGMLAFFYLIYRISLPVKDVRADLRAQQNTLSVTAVYWHFLDLLWIGLFLLLKLWN